MLRVHFSNAGSHPLTLHFHGTHPPAMDGVFPAYSEDFGSLQDVVPGVMFLLGVSNSRKGWVGMPHSPGYVADEESIFIGAEAMAAILLDQLASGESE